MLTKLFAFAFGGPSHLEIDLRHTHLFWGQPSGNPSLVLAALQVFAHCPSPGKGLYNSFISSGSRLLLELQASGGPVCWVGMRGEQGLSFYLVNSDFQPELFLDEAQRPLSEKAMKAAWKARGVGATQRIADPKEYVAILTGHVSSKKANKLKRYSCFDRQTWENWRQLLSLAGQPDTSPLPLVSQFLVGSGACSPLKLEPLRDTLSAFLRHQSDLSALLHKRPVIQELLSQRAAIQADEERAKGLYAQLATGAHNWPAELAAATDRLEKKKASFQAQVAAHGQQRLRLQERHQRISSFSQIQPTSALDDTPPPQEIAPLIAEIQTIRTSLSSLYAQVWELAHPLSFIPQSDQHANRVLEKEASILKEIALTELKITYLEKQREQERKAIETHKQQQLASLHKQLQGLEASQALATQQARQVGHTFASWLDQRYPQWEQSIGKIVKPEVLLHPYLSPRVSRLNDLLFGVELDLTDLPLPDIDIASIQDKPKQIEAEQESIQKQLQATLDTHERQLQNLDKRVKQKILPLQRSIRQWRYEAEQARLAVHKYQQQQLDQYRLQANLKAQQQLELRYRIEGEEARLHTLEQLLLLATAPSQETPVSEAGQEESIASITSALHAHLAAWKQRKEALANEIQQETQLWEAMQAGWQNWERWGVQHSLPQALTQQPSLTLVAAYPLLQDWGALQADIQSKKQALAHSLRRLLQPLGSQNVLGIPPNDPQLISNPRLWTNLETLTELPEQEVMSHFLAATYAPLAQALGTQAKIVSEVKVDPAQLSQLNTTLKGLPLPDGGQLKIAPARYHSPLVQQLRQLHAYASQRGHTLEQDNLFATTVAENTQQEAIELLQGLGKVLALYPGDSLDVGDMLPLVLQTKQPSESRWKQASEEEKQGASWAAVLAAYAQQGNKGLPIFIDMDAAITSWQACLLMAAQGSAVLASAPEAFIPNATYPWIHVYQTIEGAPQWACIKRPEGEKVPVL